MSAICGDKCSTKSNIDRACLRISNHLINNVSVFGQYDECYKCPLMYHTMLEPNQHLSLKLNTRWTYRMKFISQNTTCEWSEDFLEHYKYQYDVTDFCKEVYAISSAPSAYFPLFVTALVLMILIISWYSAECLYRYTQESTLWKQLRWTLGSFFQMNEQQQLRKSRYKSLDTFRGFCILFMIFVNTHHGGHYWFFSHSTYNGITLSDALMPWFLWIMGFTMAISINYKLHAGTNRFEMFGGVCKRSLLLIIFGLIATDTDCTLRTVKYNGALQMIGVCYFIVGTFETIFFLKINEAENVDMSCMLPEIAHTIPQWMFAIFLITVHSVLTFMVPVPGCSRGYIGPGGLHEFGEHRNCTGGVAGYIDRLWLGSHMHPYDGHRELYRGCQDITSSGILSHLTAAALVCIGAIAGRILLFHTNLYMKIGKWTFYGTLFVLIGGSLCGFSVDEGLIPLNRPLWSVSLIFVLGGSGFLIIALLHLIVDIKEIWSGSPFLHAGMNSLILYMLHNVMYVRFPFAYKPEDSNHMSYLCSSLWTTFVYMFLGIYLYYKRIFLTV